MLCNFGPQSIRASTQQLAALLAELLGNHGALLGKPPQHQSTHGIKSRWETAGTHLQPGVQLVGRLEHPWAAAAAAA